MDDKDAARLGEIILHNIDVLGARNTQRRAVAAAIRDARSGHREPRTEGAFVGALAQEVGDHRDAREAAIPDRQPFHRIPALRRLLAGAERSEEHTSELQSLMRTSYAVFCLKKNKAHY